MPGLPRNQNRIVCIAYAGAGPSVFARWHRHLGDRLFAVTLPGREAAYRQPLLRSIPAMAAFVEQAAIQRNIVGATLFGHSMGGLVAYEAARLLQVSRPMAIRRLVVSGCRIPSSPPPRLSTIADDREFVRAVSAFGGIPVSWTDTPELLRYALPILRADLAAVESYRHQPGEMLRMPLIALGAEDDPLIPMQELYNWRYFTAGSFDMRVFRGGHFFIHASADHVIGLLAS